MVRAGAPVPARCPRPLAVGFAPTAPASAARPATTGGGLQSLGTRPGRQLGKFNAGQKLNALFVAGALPVMLMTGSIMRWPNRSRLVAHGRHVRARLGRPRALLVVVIGHIVKALAEPVRAAGHDRPGTVPTGGPQRTGPAGIAGEAGAGDGRARPRRVGSGTPMPARKPWTSASVSPTAPRSSTSSWPTTTDPSTAEEPRSSRRAGRRRRRALAHRPRGRQVGVPVRARSPTSRSAAPTPTAASASAADAEQRRRRPGSTCSSTSSTAAALRHRQGRRRQDDHRRRRSALLARRAGQAHARVRGRRQGQPGRLLRGADRRRSSRARSQPSLFAMSMDTEESLQGVPAACSSVPLVARIGPLARTLRLRRHRRARA